MSEAPPTYSSPSLFILGIGAVFFVMNAWSFRQAYILKHEGASIQGTVTRTYLVKRRGSITYRADYTIDVSGKSYEGSADITRNTFLAARPGGPIALRYAPSKPSLSEAADLSHSATTLFLTEFLGFPVSLFILFLGLRKPHSAHQDLDADLTRSAGTRDIPLPNTVKGIAYTMYPVVDMKRARKFYEEDLGLRPEHDVGGKWIEYHLWDNCFAITTLAGESVKPSADAGGSVALEVQNVDDFVDQLRKKGIRIKVEPFSTRVCRMAVVVDPEGNGVTLHAKSPK